MYTKLFLILLIVINAQCLSATVSDGDKVIIYGDGTASAVVKYVEKELKDVLKQRKIKIDERGKKGSNLQSLIDSVEKEVLKKKPNLVLVTCTIADVYDVKKKTMLDGFDVGVYVKNMESLIASLRSAGLSVALATPSVAGENISSEANSALDKIAEHIRAYCEKESIACCDFRKLTIKHLTANNPDKKHKGILTKDGVQISKDGAVILAPALRKCLGMSSNGIGAPLVASDRVLFFTGSGSPFTGTAKSLFKPKMQERMDKKFAHLEQHVRPSFKLNALKDRLFQKIAIEETVIAQKARVAFIHLTSQRHPVADYKKYMDVVRAKVNKCCEKVSEAYADSGTVFMMTEATSIDDTNDPMRQVIDEMNKIVVDAATANDLQVMDLNVLLAAARAEDPKFELWLHGKFGTYYSQEFLHLVEAEMAQLVGVGD